MYHINIGHRTVNKATEARIEYALGMGQCIQSFSRTQWVISHVLKSNRLGNRQENQKLLLFFSSLRFRSTWTGIHVN